MVALWPLCPTVRGDRVPVHGRAAHTAPREEIGQEIPCVFHLPLPCKYHFCLFLSANDIQGRINGKSSRRNSGWIAQSRGNCRGINLVHRSNPFKSLHPCFAELKPVFLQSNTSRNISHLGFLFSSVLEHQTCAITQYITAVSGALLRPCSKTPSEIPHRSQQWR